MAWLSGALIAFIVIGTFGIEFYATSCRRAAPDPSITSRRAGFLWATSALSGKYLSALAFMGVAGFTMRYGCEALWHPVGYAGGFLLGMLFFAGPLRRCGTSNFDGFVENRLGAPGLRRLAAAVVLCLGIFSSLPHWKGVGIILQTLLQIPYAVGVGLLGGVVTLHAALGGSQRNTWVQAVQFWLHAVAISVPVLVLLARSGGYHKILSDFREDQLGYPSYQEEVVRTFRAGDTLVLPPVDGYPLLFETDVIMHSIGPARPPQPGDAPLTGEHFTQLIQRPLGAGTTPSGALRWPAGTLVNFHLATVVRHGQPLMDQGLPVRTPARVEFAGPAAVRFLSGQWAVGTIPNREWQHPFGTLTGRHGYPLLYTLSLLAGLICGSVGLPQLLGCSSTHSDGGVPLRALPWVLGLLGVFATVSAMWGTAGRFLMPDLYAAGKTDALILELPRLMGGLWGDFWCSVAGAAAFSACFSTLRRLLTSASGAIARGICGEPGRAATTSSDRTGAPRLAVISVGTAATLLGVAAEAWDMTTLMGWALSLAACSTFPVLLLGIRWKGLTTPGAAAGMVLGGAMSLAAVVLTMLLDARYLPWTPHPVVRTLLDQPALVGVPFSLGVTLLVSCATGQQVPQDVSTRMQRLHGPAELGVEQENAP